MDLELTGGTVIDGKRYAATPEKPIVVEDVPENVALMLLRNPNKARPYTRPVKKKVTKKKAAKK